MKNIFLHGTPFLFVFSMVSCGDNPTKFTSPDAYRVIVKVSGTGADRVKELIKQAQKSDAEAVAVESGMSPAEEAQIAEQIAKEMASAVPPESGAAQPANPASAPAGGTSAVSPPVSGSPESPSAGSNQSSANSSPAAPSTQVSNPMPPSSVPQVSNQPPAAAPPAATAEPFRVKPAQSLGQFAGRLDKFRQGCADTLKVPLSKVKFLSDSEKFAADEVLLIAIDKGLSLTTSLQGASLHGVCVYAAKGSTVSIDAGDTKLNGILSFQSGARNKTTFSFGAKGRVESALVLFAGSQNSTVFSASKISSCNAPVLVKFGAGSLTCQ
ncbi:MAG: hypothetical protein EBR09_08520 [Proteobacteria bacterium]|nr:hypothetical protein [Pseudomonadota bacterium]